MRLIEDGVYLAQAREDVRAMHECLFVMPLLTRHQNT